MLSEKHKKRLHFALIIVLIALALGSAYLIKESGITGYVIRFLAGEVKDPTLLLNLTFDDPNDPWKDYSIYEHVFLAQGNANWADRNSCKWYGCANFTFTENGNDYLNSTTKWNNMTGIAIKFWVYHTEKPKGSPSQYYFQIGDGTNIKTMQDNSFGPAPSFSAENGDASDNAGSKFTPEANAWYFYFIQYNPSEGRLYVWQNDKLVLNSSENVGQLKYDIGEIIKVGIGQFNIDLHGYLDEFAIWSRGNFTSEEILDFYNTQLLGTPPDLDLYVKSIKYTLPYDWNDDRNRLKTGGTMDVVFTIRNAGIKNSGKFNYEFAFDGSSVCKGRTSLKAGAETNIVCSWKTSKGFHKGFMILDTSNEASEDNEDNNAQRVYIPFLDRPFVHFDYDEWKNVLEPFAEDENNEVASDSYDWAKSFGCSSFNDGYTGNNVDPFGKKARECAVGCFVNDYNGKQCIEAIKHLKGWASRSATSYTDVQAIHELVHVGITYDLMFPTLTKEENDLISKQLHDICQQITNLPNTRPDLNDDEKIEGGNGKGFGSGMGGFCYTMIGTYKENPTLIQELEQQYWAKNIPDEWIDREISFLRAYKDDPWAKYQERISYKWYSQFHLVENWWFQKRFNLANLDQYQNAFCAMAREAVTEVLDFNYNGNDLRNDRDQRLRTVQTGDSYSFENIGSGSFINFAILTYYGVLCDDIDAKKAILWLRDYSHSKGDGRRGYVDSYLYKQLYDQANQEAKNPEGVFPKVIFDNANDILTIRTNYSYVDDTVIQIDGGEEKGGGHSQAQGYYVYALGEPFLDYEQVPYEDDTRMDVWKNGISLQNTPQTDEGAGGIFNNNCGDFGYNQYYGMSDCPTPKYPEDYPNHRHFPLEYGGDLEDYIGTKDANFAGVYVWRPYKNAENAREYFVKFGDLLAKRTVVSGNTEGKGIYHNFINIYDEFSETRKGNDLTFARNGKNLDINVIYSPQPLTIGGGKTNVRYCFSKTSCSGSKGGKGNYRRTYLHAQSSDLDLILSHHWYLDGQKQSITAVNNDDNGLRQGSNVIIFDTNDDNAIRHNNKEINGWALAYNDNLKEIGAFNTTYIRDNNIVLLQSDDTLSAHLARSPDKIVLTANTMSRSKHIDEPKKVRVTIDAQELTKNANFKVTKNDKQNTPIVSESGTQVTFDVQSGQNSDFYTITGGGVSIIPVDEKSPTIISAQAGSTTTESSVINVRTDENANLTVLWGYLSNNLGNAAINTQHQKISTVSLSNLSPNSTIFYNVTSCDISGNCASNGIFSFATLASVAGDGPDEEANKTKPGQNKTGPSPPTRKPPKREKFDGATTDFDLVADLERVENPRLEIADRGKIVFSGLTNMSGLDLDAHIIIEHNLISLNSRILKSLNKSAALTLYNLTFSSPRIKRDDEACPANICQIISYRGGNLTFNVVHFTNYTAEEEPQTESSSEESAESGSEEQPSSESGSEGSSSGVGRDSGGGSGFAVSCIEDWECTDWSICEEDDVQARSCSDKNKCGTLSNKPDEARNCAYLGAAEVSEEEGADEADIVGAIKQIDVPVMKDKSRGVKISTLLALTLFIALTCLTYIYIKKYRGKPV